MTIKKSKFAWFGRKTEPAKEPVRKRPLYWNFTTVSKEKKTVYYFLITHTDIREVEDITTNIILAKMPTTIKSKQIDGNVDRLLYRILTVNTHNRRANMRELARAYNGVLRQDNRLYERQIDYGLEEYVRGKLEKTLLK